MSFGLNANPAPLRLYQLRDFDTALYIVADEAKRPLFEKRNPASLPSICVPDGDASEERRYSLRKTLNMPQNK